MEKILQGVPIYKQQGYELCWAACLEMVFNFFTPLPKISGSAISKITQYELISYRYGLVGCHDIVDTQTGKIKSIYDKAALADDLIRLGLAYGYSVENRLDVDKYWEILKSEINENRPLIANIGFHYVVIVGFLENEEDAYFFYNDPKKDFLSKKKFRNEHEGINIEELLTIKTFSHGSTTQK